jgi:hypothetical protein
MILELFKKGMVTLSNNTRKSNDIWCFELSFLLIKLNAFIRRRSDGGHLQIKCYTLNSSENLIGKPAKADGDEYGDDAV